MAGAMNAFRVPPATWTDLFMVRANLLISSALPENFVTLGCNARLSRQIVNIDHDYVEFGSLTKSLIRVVAVHD